MKLRRIEKRITQRSLAQRLGLNTSTVSRYESDSFGKMDGELAEKFSKILDLDISLLIEPGYIPREKIPEPFRAKEEEGSAKTRVREQADVVYSQASSAFRDLSQENEASMPIPFFENAARITSGFPDRYVNVRAAGLTDDFRKYFAIKAAPYTTRQGFRRKNFVFEKNAEIQDGKKQLLMCNGEIIFGLVRELKGIVAIRTELEDEGLLLFDSANEDIQVLGTLIG